MGESHRCSVAATRSRADATAQFVKTIPGFPLALDIQQKRNLNMSALAVSITDEYSKSQTMTSEKPKTQRDMSDAELVQAGFRYALSIARHHQDAEDLVQQAWMKLIRAYGKVEGTPVLFKQCEISFTIRNAGARSSSLNPWSRIRKAGSWNPRAFLWIWSF